MAETRATSALTHGEPAAREASGTLPVAPHLLFFFLYNLVYFVPLLAVHLFGYSEIGTGQTSDMANSTMLRVMSLYCCGAVTFFLGTRIRCFLLWATKGSKPFRWRPRWFRVSFADKLAILCMVVVFVASKIALIPVGVYKEYAFDADLMNGPVWNFSMFCSETLVLLALFVLFSKSRHNLLAFFAISAVNGINLLHGTRIFFISGAMSLVAYLYVRGRLRLRQALLYGPLALAALLLATYAVYLLRSRASFSGGLSVAKLLSPLIFESIFSQLSLVATVNSPSVWSLTGHLSKFISDLFLFITPRIIVPDKDSLLYLRNFDYLSPKGGFNGYAIGLIYLGMFFPFFYFLLGVLGDWLYMLSRKSSWWFILYLFYSIDFLLHIMRDGYLIPIKMLINIVQWIGILIAFRWLLKIVPDAPVLKERPQ